MAIDVPESDFQRVVVDGSRKAPVVVDFWAAWCAPCRSLGPILERVAGETGITLAKVDVDANPNISGAFGIRSIPTVYAFKDGLVADSFVGALPEQQVRQFFAGLQPTEAARLSQQAEAAEPSERESLYRAALERDRAHRGGVLGLARILTERGDVDEARKLLGRIPEDAEVTRLLAELELKRGAGAELDSLRARMNADPNDLNAAVELARAEAVTGLHAEALARLLEAAQRGSDDARRVMVDIFRVLGDDHELTRSFRQKLASTLF